MAIDQSELVFPRDRHRENARYLRSTTVSGGLHTISVVATDGEDIESVFVRHVQLRHVPMNYRILRRVLDVAASSLLLILFSPVVIVVALAIKLTSRGP